MIVLDILLIGNLVLFAVCAFRSPSPRSTRIDDLVGKATGRRPPVAVLHTPPQPVVDRSDNVIPFPSPADAARRRGKSVHPSGGLRHHPGAG